MKLRLPGKAETRTEVRREIRNPLHDLDAGHPRSARSLELGVEDLVRFAGRDEEVAIQPLESAIDPLLANDRLDPIDSRRMTAGR
jgi:hypothetical protein